MRRCVTDFLAQLVNARANQLHRLRAPQLGHSLQYHHTVARPRAADHVAERREQRGLHIHATPSSQSDQTQRRANVLTVRGTRVAA